MFGCCRSVGESALSCGCVSEGPPATTVVQRTRQTSMCEQLAVHPAPLLVLPPSCTPTGGEWSPTATGSPPRPWTTYGYSQPATQPTICKVHTTDTYSVHPSP